MADGDFGNEPGIARAFRASALATLRAEARAELVSGAVRAEVPARRVVYQEGQRPVPSLVVAGLFRQYVTGPQDRQASVFYARPGVLLGFAESLDGPSRVGCQAVTDGYLLRFSMPSMEAFAAAEPELALAIARETVSRLSRLIGELRSTAFGTVRQRVARHLLDLAGEHDASDRLVAPVNHQQLADAAGTVRETVGRLLAELRREGLVTASAEGIVVLDALSLYAEGWPDG